MRVYIALITLSLIWGLSFVFISILSEPAGVWGTVFIRCIAGALLLLPMLWLKRKEIIKPIPWKALVVVGIVNAGLPWGLIALSQTQINSSLAAVLNAFTPIFTGLIGLLFFGTILLKQQWIGIALGFVGILIIMDFDLSLLFGESFVGIGTMILATMCYGFSSHYVRKHLREAGIIFITTCTLIIGAVVGGIMMLLTNPNQLHTLTQNLNGEVVFAIIGLGFFGSGIAHLLFFYIMKERSAEFATSVTYLIPISAIFWGYFLLKEPITLHMIIGLLIILCGVYLTTRPKLTLLK
ncbi:EamA family transporter [Paenisporosarcina quisquiliarum]|uniref:EamA family transporter n=1 Tax=Paenisporosarcina quisquiliarum TaxID=365346 RepID=A0A9X3LJI0_9BACL|nr:EamA family transporter [Paenisporosarcina quisquiliarum]MCZ8538146.1 EamA family transporter [Paenisporosarcina quisquiliarum]